MPRSVQSGDRSARNGPLPERHHQSGGGRRRKSASQGQLALLSRTPFSHPEGGGSPRLCSSEGGKHGSHSGPLPGCSPFSSCSQAGAPWPWLRDTAATLGMTLPTPSTPEGRAGSKQLWGMGVRVTPEASDVCTVMLARTLPGTDSLSCLCLWGLSGCKARDSSPLPAPKARPHSIKSTLSFLLSASWSCSSWTWAAGEGAPGNLTGTCSQSSSRGSSAEPTSAI